MTNLPRQQTSPERNKHDPSIFHYIFPYVENISTLYHNGGAVIIRTDRNPEDEIPAYVAEYNSGLAEYDKLLNSEEFIRSLVIEKDAGRFTKLELSPSEEPVREVMVFEDAGCC